MNGFVIDSSKVLEDLRSQLLAERKKRFEAEARSKRLEAKLREKLATDDGFVNGSPISTQVRVKVFGNPVFSKFFFCAR
jgi:uncharacterized protein with von Willebrand factor type A (vWA) domain